MRHECGCHCDCDDDDTVEDLEMDEKTLKRFVAYYKKNPSWGSFHACLSDGNYECTGHEDWAREQKDKAGIPLGKILDGMTYEQRRSLASKCEEILDAKKAKDSRK